MPASPTVVKVAAVQFDPKIGEVEANLKAILTRLDEAASSGARLIVFPECALTGYGFESKDEAMPYAEPVPGPSTREVAAACDRLGVHVVLGLLERDGDRLFNVATLIGPGGVVGTYRKIHLPFLGIDRFVDPGDQPLAVLNAGDLRVGLHICYDGTFPETGRVLTLLGADVLILPTNWPIQSVTTAEHLPACRAIENVVYVMAVDRVGEERGCVFAGLSSIADPGGNILAKAGPVEDAILYAEVDPAVARRKRLIRVPGKYELDRIGDRRPGFYEPIVHPNGRE